MGRVTLEGVEARASKEIGCSGLETTRFLSTAKNEPVGKPIVEHPGNGYLARSIAIRKRLKKLDFLKYRWYWTLF